MLQALFYLWKKILACCADTSKESCWVHIVFAKEKKRRWLYFTRTTSPSLCKHSSCIRLPKPHTYTDRPTLLSIRRWSSLLVQFCEFSCWPPGANNLKQITEKLYMFVASKHVHVVSPSLKLYRFVYREHVRIHGNYTDSFGSLLGYVYSTKFVCIYVGCMVLPDQKMLPTSFMLVSLTRHETKKWWVRSYILRLASCVCSRSTMVLPYFQVIRWPLQCTRSSWDVDGADDLTGAAQPAG
jgi:hypothetical protein